MTGQSIFRKCLIILSGPPLHGKTSAAQDLARRSNLTHVDVDLLKQEQSPNRDFSKGTDKDVMAAMYGLTIERAKEHLARGMPAIVSGTFSRATFKAPFLRFLGENDGAIPVRIFRLDVGSFDHILPRIQKRVAEGHPSSILTEEKYRWALSIAEPWPPQVEVMGIDAGLPVVEVANNLLRVTSDLQMNVGLFDPV